MTDDRIADTMIPLETLRKPDPAPSSNSFSAARMKGATHD